MDAVQKITQALKPISDKIGQGAKIEWSAYYRQTYINAWTTIIFWGIALIATLIAGTILFKKFDRTYNNPETKNYDRNFYMYSRIWVVVVSSIFSLMFIGIIITQGIQPLLNPIYQTTHDIIGELQKKDNE